MSTVTEQTIQCYHCGEDCLSDTIEYNDKYFCCEGCKLVYNLLDENGLCEYYNLNEMPGVNQRKATRRDKFNFLQDAKIRQQLISYSDETQTHVTFYLPHIHCSSCLWLLENLHRLHKGVVKCTVNFTRKEAAIVFNPKAIDLQQVADLLTQIGYEPYISLNDLGNKKPRVPRNMIYQLGVAGFCFGNVMLFCFPEYLGLADSEKYMQQTFRYLNIILSLPVMLYSAQPFYKSAWKGIRHKFLNIDVPIALAIIVTFIRSLVDVLIYHGGGYFDTLTGLVFFMLIGRMAQEKTYQRLSFERDYTSYFPIAVTVLKGEQQVPTSLPDIKPNDTLLIHNEELIPADGIIVKGKGYIDYSFVTGESLPVLKETGELVYAGGKQTGGNMELLVIKEVAQSYLTSLWNKNGKRETSSENNHRSFVHILSKYFTYVVLSIATVTAIYWWIFNPSLIWNAVTTILIITCPCALLLANTFTNGNILHILSRNKLYLRNAQTIEDIAATSQIVFDKTGTLTYADQHEIYYEGAMLSDPDKQYITALAMHSGHPLSKALAKYIGRNNLPVSNYKEHTGMGTDGIVEGHSVAIGSQSFITGNAANTREGTSVYIRIDGEVKGLFIFRNYYRNQMGTLINALNNDYGLSVLSGDNAGEKLHLEQIFGQNSTIRFNQKPEDKLQYIVQLQQKGERVMMIGDGLNDAGALLQSNTGIAIAEDSNNFTPASDAIMEAKELPRLAAIINMCKYNRKIVMSSFMLSILYNIVGLYFAVQGTLSPLIAAILMPASSLTIILLTFGASNWAAKRLKL